jgi:hypothetical protein
MVGAESEACLVDNLPRYVVGHLINLLRLNPLDPCERIAMTSALEILMGWRLVNWRGAMYLSNGQAGYDPELANNPNVGLLMFQRNEKGMGEIVVWDEV